VAEVEVAVAGVVRLEVRGLAEGVEQGVAAGQQGRPEAAALLVGVHRQVGEVMVGSRGASGVERPAEDRHPGGDVGRQRGAGAGGASRLVRGPGRVLGGGPAAVLARAVVPAVTGVPAEGVAGPQRDPVEAAAGVPGGCLAARGCGGGDDDLAGGEDVVDDRREIALGEDPP
jgi:hypothetical protein